ncbi:MIT domain-containing protein 1-like isoform X1 [Thrips palmi]|uniref:MIT domain-containing protein 1-like isoform X1 n=1 Tax=Thrips palmi TaxID=161013 RepID=A0A6P8ZMT4_THRPL|nr:MIT domain-containing protein 1-like isoform X1 [Thrips palmi]XP_034241159.1 MIT domain-containing protein 1-like isoform X1 [Thrips palmi]
MSTSGSVELGIAIGILQRAVELDKNNRFTESLVCYEQGLRVLLEVIKNTTDGAKKTQLRLKVEEYMTRAESIKKLIADKKARGEYREQVVIEADSTGHSYESVFGRFLDAEVTDISVEDPYIRNFHQCQNFLKFCELAVMNCSNLKTISLVTNIGHSQQEAQDTNSWLNSLKNSLQPRNVTLSVEIRPTLHDRTIRLSNGWIIKIGRGLDYFKSPENKMALGVFNMDLRKCHETTVDIFHKGANNTTNSIHWI